MDLENFAPALLDALPVPVMVVVGPSGRVLRWNRAAAEACGEGRLASATLTDLLRDVADPSRPATAAAAALGGRTALVDVDASLACATGPRRVAVSIQRVSSADDTAAVLCYPTARWAEATGGVRRDDERLEIALSAAFLGSWEYDLTTRVLMSSPQCKANHGFAPDEDMQLHPHVVDAIAADHRERFLYAIDHAVEMLGTFQIEVPNRWRDGTDHWLLVAGRVVDATRIVGVSQDITERRRVEQALRDSEQQYRALVDAANEGIWRLDQDARITFVNDRMAEMLGVTPAEMFGRHKWDFVFDEDVPAMRAIFERRTLGISEEVADIRFRRGDGREIWTLMSARPLYDHQGRFIGAVDLFTDITDRRRVEEALRDSDRRKDEFLAVLAHELRGPLAPILTAVKLLQAKGSPDPALQRLRDTIHRQTLQLSKLVDDLLDVGRITAGKLRLDKRPTDLRDVARQAVEASSALIERKGHTLTVRLPDVPIYLDADAARLVQVTTNLLNNAAKYSPDGGHIEVVAVEGAGMGGLSIRDRGVGIPADMLDRIFDRFVQIGTSGHRSEGGLGIGLSVVKALVDLHGGTIEAHSGGIGQGSEFTFRVPLAARPVPV